jgi:FtsZ-interacting cell division protein ZipA
MTPETLFDPGTPHTINVSAYSINYPKQYFNAAVTVVTKGVYISPLIFFYAIIIIVIIIIIYFLFFYIWKRREKTVYGKPEKPWKIPEEQAHLRELKKTDKKAYDQERLMMEDEYKSAMLYYQDYRQSLKAKLQVEAPKKEEPPKKPLPKLFKKSERPPKVEEKKVEAIVPAEDKSKEQALAKIQREQAKQLKRKKE